MVIRYAWPAVAAVVLSSTAIFAQSSSQRATEAGAQTSKAEETPITLVGCIQREADYRRAHSLGRGGAIGAGLGRADEYVLINASGAGADAQAPATIDCARETTAEAYELTGGREDDLKPFVGRAVQITGIRKAAKVEQPAGTSGTGAARPTGGVDPLKQDLRLFEVEVTSFQEVAPASAPSAAAAAPAAPAGATAPEAQPTGTAGTARQLPRTASPLPLIGLLGLLSLLGGFGLRALRRD